MKKRKITLVLILIAVLCLCACTPAESNIAERPVDHMNTSPSIVEPDPQAENTHTEPTTPPTTEIIEVEFELSEEMLTLTLQNCPAYIGSYVKCPAGFLANIDDPLCPSDYTVVHDINPETEFKVIGVYYLEENLEDIPPITRADFQDIPYYEDPEDPMNFTDWDYFHYLGAAIPICREVKGILCIQETEISPIYYVAPGVTEFSPQVIHIWDDESGQYIEILESNLPR